MLVLLYLLLSNFEYGLSLYVIDPPTLDWVIRPPSRLRSVVLPLPEGPMRARTSPGLADPVIPCNMPFSSLPVIPLRSTL